MPESNAKPIEPQGIPKLLKELIDETKRDGRAYANDLLAAKIGIARSAVFAWLNGKQRPRPKQLDALAEFFAHGNDWLVPELRRRLYAAADISLESSESATNPLVRARERSGLIRAGLVQYDPEGVGKFIFELFHGFLDFCGFDYSCAPIPFGSVVSSISSGEIDIAAGHWQSPDRLRALRYISFPVAVGLNGITYASAKHALKGMDAVSRLDQIYAIMNSGQSAYGIAQSVLKLPSARIRTVEYDPKSFVNALNYLFEEYLANPKSLVPVIFTDEVMCRSIYTEMVGNYRHIGSPDILWKLPSTSEGSDSHFELKSNDGRLISAHPRYDLSICVNRGNDDGWYNFIEDSWRIFLRGNKDFVKSIHRKTRDHIAKDIDMIKSIDPSYTGIDDENYIWLERMNRLLPVEHDDLVGIHSADLWNSILK